MARSMPSTRFTKGGRPYPKQLANVARMTAKKPGDAIMSNNEDDDDDDESLISSEESSSSSSSSEDYSTDSDTKRFRQLWDERRKHQRLLRFLQVRHPQVLAEYQKLFDEEKKVGKHNQGKCVSKG